MPKSILTIFTVVLSLCALAQGVVRFAAPSGTGAGTSWADAASLQTAVDAAVAGDEIWAAAGTYTGGASPVLTMKEGVSLYGGFTGVETARGERDWGVNQTVIDGGGILRCVMGAADATLDGFTVRNGVADSAGGMYGGAATHCRFENNVASGYDANWNEGDALGGALLDGSATDCLFINNSAYAVGYLEFGTRYTAYGGAMNGGTAVNCKFFGNSAGNGGYGFGGAVAFATTVNCLFYGNVSDSSGGGADLTTAVNCTFVHNTSRYGGGMAGGTAVNCIFRDNAPEDAQGATITFSCLTQAYSGDGNLAADPLFVDATGADFRLRAVSPCVDTATPDGAPGDDLLGVARPQGGGVDMGAYEYWDASGGEGIHSADTNADSAIQLPELLRVIQFFNMSGYACDANGVTLDGYTPGAGADHACTRHDSDYDATPWVIALPELLRLIQFFNMGGYHACPDEGTADGYCPGKT